MHSQGSSLQENSIRVYYYHYNATGLCCHVRYHWVVNEREESFQAAALKHLGRVLVARLADRFFRGCEVTAKTSVW